MDDQSFEISGVIIRNVTFVNWTKVDGCFRTRAAIATNAGQSAAVPVTHISNIKQINVDKDALIYIDDPNPRLRNLEDCGEAQDCTGLNNYLIKNDDTTVTGETGMVISNNFKVSDPGRCTYYTMWNAYQCKPTAKHEMLVFESLDSDTLTRRVQPVVLTAEADSYFPEPFYNNLNSFEDVRWDQGYTSLKRLSRFPSLVQKGRTYNISFTGTNPRSMRFAMRDDVDA